MSNESLAVVFSNKGTQGDQLTLQECQAVYLVI